MKRGCAGIKPIIPQLPGGQYIAKTTVNQVQPSRLEGVEVVSCPRASSPSSSMHLGSSLWSGATRSPHGVAFQAILDTLMKKLNAKAQRRIVYFFEHEIHRRNEIFRSFRVFRVLIKTLCLCASAFDIMLKVKI